MTPYFKVYIALTYCLEQTVNSVLTCLHLCQPPACTTSPQDITTTTREVTMSAGVQLTTSSQSPSTPTDHL